MRTKKVALMIASGALLVLGAAACNGDGYGNKDSANDKPAAVETPAATKDAGEGGNGSGSASTGGTIVKVVDNPSLGEIVVDGKGRTLYRFDKDSNNPPKSTCVGECATKWPALIASDDLRISGVDPNLIGTIKRPDGKLQVTLNGWALYTFAGDQKAGDINGQGVGGTWFVSTPQGKKAMGTGGAATPTQPTKPAPTTPSRKDEDYGYGNSGSGNSGGGYNYGY